MTTPPSPLDPQKLLALATERVPGFLSLLEGLVIRESPSGDEARNRLLADFLTEEIERRGGRVERRAATGFGDHLLARFEGGRGQIVGRADAAEEALDRGNATRDPATDKTEAAPTPGSGTRSGPLLVVGHMDTVHAVGTIARFPFELTEWTVRGPGAYDMKAGLATALHALDVLAAAGEAPSSDLTLLITCDEEIGSGTSRALIEELARSSRAALVLEPCIPGGAMKLARKGVGWYRVTVHGRPAHAGIEPEKGASAVHEMARLTMRLLELGDREVGTTINVGVVNGGTRGNVVAAEAVATVDVRFWTAEEAARVDREVRALVPEDARCSIEIEGGIDRPPLESTPESEALAVVAQQEAERIGMNLPRGTTGGGSDGNLTSGAGCPTLDGLGPDGGGAHTLDEHVLTADIARRVALVAALFRTL